MKAGIKAVLSDYGYKGKVLNTKAKRDAKYAKQAMTKIYKAEYNIKLKDSPRLQAWHHKFFDKTCIPDKIDKQGGGTDQDGPSKTKNVDGPQPSKGVSKKKMPEGGGEKISDKDGKVKIYVHSEDVKTTVTVSSSKTRF